MELLLRNLCVGQTISIKNPEESRHLRADAAAGESISLAVCGERLIAGRDEGLLIRFAHPKTKSWAGPTIRKRIALDADTAVGSVTELTHQRGQRCCHQFSRAHASSATTRNRRTCMQGKHNNTALHHARGIDEVGTWRKVSARFYEKKFGKKFFPRAHFLGL